MIIAFGVVVLLALHLLCMNVSSAGPLLCIWLHWRGTRNDDAGSVRMAREMAFWSVLSLVVGSLLGVAVGYLSMVSGDRRLVEILPLFRDKIGWGVLELLCSSVWMLGYWVWLKFLPPKRTVATWLHRSLAVLSATNLLYHFPPLLTVMAQTSRGRYQIDEPVTAAAFRRLIYTPEVLAHTSHFLLASIAVSGVFLWWLARRLDEPKPMYVQGARVALLATVLQIPAGIWLLTVIPAAAQSRLLLGGSGAGRIRLFILAFLQISLLRRLNYLLLSVRLNHY